MEIKICDICLEDDLDYIVEGLSKYENVTLNIGCHFQCALKSSGKLFAIVPNNPFPITASSKEELLTKLEESINKA